MKILVVDDEKLLVKGIKFNLENEGDVYKRQTQHYVLDGFIVSPNIEVLSVETQSLGFRYSDHNPVRCV